MGDADVMFALRDYQQDAEDLVRESMMTNAAVLLVLATGAGKCLAKDTPVLMYDGNIKPVQDILPGELLMGPDGQPRRVETLARGREKMYRVTPTKGEPYTVNESHILSLRITGAEGRVRRCLAGDGRYYSSGEICNISVRDYMQSSPTFKHLAKGWRTGVDFERGDQLPVPAYIIGAWLGDGHTGKLSFTTGDNELAHEINAYAKSAGMRCVVEQNSDWSVTIHLCSNGVKYGRAGSPFGNALRELGIFRDKAIPHAYKTASRADRLELLAGLIDTDGHYDGKGFSLTLKSERLLDDAIFVARSLGFSAYKSTVQKKCHNNGVTGTYFSCHINGHIDEVPCRLRRKQAKPREQKKNVLNVGITVKPVGEGDYYGFEISGPDRLFLLGDFTVTHNTVIFSDIAKRAAAKGNRVLILAHRDTLIRQASNKLTEYGVEHGIIMAGCTPNPRLRVQVASVQTMVRRIKKHDYHFDLIIIDEAHLSAAKSYGDVVDAIRTVRPGARVLGVTGSPCRLDNKGLGVGFGGMFEHMVVGISIKDLIDRKFLVRPVVYASPTQLDLSSVRTTAGDFNTHDLSDLIDKPQLVGDAVNHYRKICPDVPAVAWCVTVGHARHVADQFNAAGIAAVALSGDDDTGARERALRGLARGTIKVITFCQLLVEGVDCPAIGAIIILRPTKSLASYLQVIGRGLRPHGSKDRCYVLDHAGCTFYHGFADDIRGWSLEGAPKRKKKKDDEPAVDVLQCPKCYLCHEPAPACPSCGHVYVASRQRNVEHVDGDLQEITPEMREAMSRQRRQEQGRAQTVEELIALGHHPKAAEKIVQARAAKQELISALIADMTAWSESTNQYPLPTFGVSFRDIRYMKPKALKDLRARFDAHKAAYLAGDENARIIQSELL